MPRFVLPMLVASFVVGCADFAPAAPSLGALRVHGVVGQGELHLDGVPRGPVQAEQRFEGLAAGVHLIDVRREGVVVASMPVEVRAGMILDARIEAPVVVVASSTAQGTQASRVSNRPAPTEPTGHSAEPVEAPGAESLGGTPTAAAGARSAGVVPSTSGARADRHSPDHEPRQHEAAPSTADIERALSGVRACAVAGRARAQIAVEVSGATGRAQHVSLSGSFSSPAVRACLERVLAQSSYPRGRRPTYTIRVVRSF